MFKKPIFLNCALLIISGVLTYSISHVWLSYSKAQMYGELLTTSEVAESPPHKKTAAKTKQVSLSSYDNIGKQNIFRPQRREWTPPPPKKEEPKPPPPVKKPPEPIPPPPLPDPAVLGIILGDDGERIAIMQGHRREEIPTRTGRRGRRSSRKVPDRIVADRMRTYHEGDIISESVILEIKKDRVIVEQNGEKKELELGNKPAKSTSPTPPRSNTRRRVPASRTRRSSPRTPTALQAEQTDAEQESRSSRKDARRERLQRIRKSRSRR